MSVVTRTNLATNPSAATTATNYAAVAGTGGTAGIAWNSGAGYQGIPGYPRVTWSVATSAVSGGISYTQTGLAAAVQYSTQIWVRCSKAQTVNLKVDFRNASNTIINTVTGSNVTLVANTWTQLTVNGTSGAAVTNAVFTAQAVTGGSNWANGDWLDGEAICPEAPTIVRTNFATNPNFETGTTGIGTAAGTGGTVAVTQATGGQVGTYCSRITWSVASTGGGSAGIIYNETISGTTGDIRYGGVWMRSSAAKSIALLFRFRTGTTPVGSYTSAYVTLAANTWTWFETPALAATGAYTNIQVYALLNNSVVNAINDTLDIDGAYIGDQPAPFFDGNTPDTATTHSAWTGTPNASSSVQWSGDMTYFDGSFVNANSIMYAWTGTANASTSTAKTYTPVIALVAKPTFDPCPRVEVTITDLTPTDNVVNLWRTADGKRQAVRGARKWTVNGSNFIIDYEPPLGRSVAYDVEVVSGLNYGAGVTQQATTVNSATWCIQDPLVPSSAIALDVSKRDSSKPYLMAAAVKALEYAAGVNIIPILGSSAPVALMGQRSIAAEVNFSMFTNTATVTTQLRNLLQQTPLLLVRPNGVRNDGVPGLAYYASARPVEHPVTVAFGGTLTSWELKGDLVAAPTMNVLVPIWTYGTVAALWATYQQAQTALAAKTYLDVLKSPSGI